MNIAVRHDHRLEFELNPEFLELNSYRSEPLAGLHDGERKLAARQETGFLAVHGDEVWFGQDLEQVLGLQGANHRPEMDIRTEEEHVQNVTDVSVCRERPAGAGRVRDLLGSEGSELSRRDSLNGLVRSGRDHIDAKQRQRGAIDLGEL